jgi:hypothetical protein
MKMSEETKAKIRATKLGPLNPMYGKKAWNTGTKGLTKANKTTFKKGQLPWNKGVKMSEKTRVKLSNSLKIKFNSNGWMHWGKGKKRPEEVNQKISVSLTGKPSTSKTKFKKGLLPWNKGKIGPESHSWQGGKSFEPYSSEWTKSLKISVRERDGYTCQMCNDKQNEKTFAVHHIDYNKKNCSPDNLITLCPSCHTKTNVKRNYWIKYFRNLIPKQYK